MPTSELRAEKLQNGSPSEPLKRLLTNEIKPAEENELLKSTEPRPRAGFGWGQCTNFTDEILLVYGPQIPGSIYDNSLYCLPPGWTTPNDWDCDGFFIPDDRIANQAFSKLYGPLAIKYIDGIHFAVTKSAPNEYRCFGNQGAFRPGEVNWQIPGIHSGIVQAVCA